MQALQIKPLHINGADLTAEQHANMADTFAEMADAAFESLELAQAACAERIGAPKGRGF